SSHRTVTEWSVTHGYSSRYNLTGLKGLDREPRRRGIKCSPRRKSNEGGIGRNSEQQQCAANADESEESHWILLTMFGDFGQQSQQRDCLTERNQDSCT